MYIYTSHCSRYIHVHVFRVLPTNHSQSRNEWPSPILNLHSIVSLEQYSNLHCTIDYEMLSKDRKNKNATMNVVFSDIGNSFD